MANWIQRLTRQSRNAQKQNSWNQSLLRRLVTGSFYKVSDLRGSSSIATIKTQIDTMRALANDSQISTALSYYATDATTPNSGNHIIWGTAISPDYQEVEKIIEAKFSQWNVDAYARDHILELATIGNLIFQLLICIKIQQLPASSRLLLIIIQ